MNLVIELFETIPLYVIGLTLLVLAGAIVLVVWKSLQEGREVSFWPPKIGARPPYSKNAETDVSEEQIKQIEGRIPRVRLPVDQVAYLSLTSGKDIGSAWPISSGVREIRIGSAPGSDIYLHQEASVSKSHFMIHVKPVEGALHRGYQFFVHDMGSASGTFVNGAKVGFEPYEVADKDEIEAGSCKFILHVTAGNSESVELTGGDGQTVFRGRD